MPSMLPSPLNANPAILLPAGSQVNILLQSPNDASFNQQDQVKVLLFPSVVNALRKYWVSSSSNLKLPSITCAPEVLSSVEDAKFGTITPIYLPSQLKFTEAPASNSVPPAPTLLTVNDTRLLAPDADGRLGVAPLGHKK